MLATKRLLQIEEAFSDQVARMVVLELDGETLRLVLYFRDGTNLVRWSSQFWRFDIRFSCGYTWHLSAGVVVGDDNRCVLRMFELRANSAMRVSARQKSIECCCCTCTGRRRFASAPAAQQAQ